MADEETQDPTPDPAPAPAPAPTPAVDVEALGRSISSQVSAGIAQALAQRQQEAAPAPPQDALEEVIAPYIRKSTGQAVIIAQLAADAADFYNPSDPDEKADRMEAKEEIERRAQTLLQQGRPLPRADIYRHYLGEKIDSVVEKRVRRKQERETAVLDAVDQGGQVPRPTKGKGVLDVDRAHGLSESGKLGEALEGHSF